MSVEQIPEWCRSGCLRVRHPTRFLGASWRTSELIKSLDALREFPPIDPARNVSRSACPAAATPLASSSDRRISDQRNSRAERAATWVPSRFTTRYAAMTGGRPGSATVGLLPATLPDQRRRGLGVRCGGSHTRRGQVSGGPNPPGTWVSLVTGIAACRQHPVSGERRRTAPSRVRGSSAHTAEGSPRCGPGGPKNEATLAAQARPGRSAEGGRHRTPMDLRSEANRQCRGLQTS